MGDSTDDIPGIYGIGPVKSRQILDAVPVGGTDWEFYKEVGEAWLKNTERDKKETDKQFLSRVMGKLGISCRLLWLSREMGDLWDAPPYEVTPMTTVTDDTEAAI